MLELIKAKNGEKNCPARKNRKGEDSDDFIKEKENSRLFGVGYTAVSCGASVRGLSILTLHSYALA